MVASREQGLAAAPGHHTRNISPPLILPQATHHLARASQIGAIMKTTSASTTATATSLQPPTRSITIERRTNSSIQPKAFQPDEALTTSGPKSTSFHPDPEPMGLFGFGQSEADKRAEEIRTGAVAPTRTERAQCWASRDTYFACLDRAGIVDPAKNAAEAAKACGRESAQLDRDCAAQWVCIHRSV